MQLQFFLNHVSVQVAVRQIHVDSQFTETLREKWQGTMGENTHTKLTEPSKWKKHQIANVYSKKVNILHIH